ncbi:MAG: transketolase C-terminal domain-containing protein, partial [Candidatus Omnitrophica bacterium]|nr:transketolase C-terminal domain-containing protein [Candidatus Omnitrophota bacterium]
CCRSTRGIVVCEEHSNIGGLASAVQEAAATGHPAKVLQVGIKNRFGQSGEPEELLKAYNLKSSDIEQAVLSAIA